MEPGAPENHSSCSIEPRHNNRTLQATRYVNSINMFRWKRQKSDLQLRFVWVICYISNALDFCLVLSICDSPNQTAMLLILLGKPYGLRYRWSNSRTLRKTWALWLFVRNIMKNLFLFITQIRNNITLKKYGLILFYITIVDIRGLEL